ncbi:MAG TPA: hypothetical protein VF746_06710 [Longimicrobium sp.]
MLLVGCTDKAASPVAPPAGPELDATPVVDSPGPDLVIHPRFEIDLDVEGTLRPGHPIHFTVRGSARFATREGEVRLILPEVAAAERSGWEVVEIPAGEESPAHFGMRKSFAVGETFRERATIIIPEPGYYSVMAVATQRSDDRATDGGQVVGTGAGRELWLWIDEHGGRVTERFDPTLFPGGTRRVRGPLGSERKPPRIRHRGTVVTCSIWSGDTTQVVMTLCPSTDSVTLSPPPPPPPDGNATAAVTVTYNDQGTGIVRPLAEAWVAWKVFDTATSSEVGRGGGYTNASGVSPTIDCLGPSSGRRLELTVHTENRKAEVKSYITSNPDRTTAGQYFGACGGSIAVTADNQQSHLFTNLNKTWGGHRSRFGSDPPAIIRAGLYPVSSYGTRYDYIQGELHIEPAWDHIWGEMGVLVAAHEYGHLWQDRYLYQSPARDGLMRYYRDSCPREHFPGNKTNFGCALGEAFADWYAVLVREGDLPNWKRDLEENRHYLNCAGPLCTDDGSVVQGAIHAFLWDITDPTGETNDNVQKAPSDVTIAIKTCEVSLQVGGSFSPYTGIDHLIWCMEDRFPYQVRMITSAGERLMTFFDTRPQSSWAQDARGFTVDPFSDNFRRLWLFNLYRKRDGVGGVPTFRNLQPEEDPAIPPDEPTDPTCGTQITC